MRDTLRRMTVYLAPLVALLAPALAQPAAEDTEARRAWEEKVGKRLIERPAFAYVEDDPTLPRVLLIGDSISIGYTAPVREKLAGKANVHRIPANGGDTARGLANLDSWLGDGDWDVIHFNWGLHDLKRLKDGQLDASMPKAVTPEDYATNLQSLVQRLKRTGAKLIWAATTPVPEGAAGRIPGDDETYNAIAARVMAEADVPVNDLYGYIKPGLDKWQRKANVHFVPEGSEHLAARVAEVIDAALPE